METPDDHTCPPDHLVEDSTKNEDSPPQQTTQLESYAFPLFVETLRGDTVELQMVVSDNVQEVKQMLFDSPETCDLTNYNLEFQGKTLMDHDDLVTIEGLKPGSTIQMTEALYNKRHALTHIRRLREIISFHLFEVTNINSPSLYSYFGPPEHEDKEKVEEENTTQQQTAKKKNKNSNKRNNKSGKKNKNNGNNKGNKNENNNKNNGGNKKAKKQKSNEKQLIDMQGTLSKFFPEEQKVHPRCTKEISFSGWNPPPGNRVLLGDLYYLEILTMENRCLHVTCWTNGFYINRSTKQSFNPLPSARPCHSHYLSGLIEQVSPLFKAGFDAVVQHGFYGKHPFELLSVPMAISPWISKPETNHKHDRNRAEYSIIETEIDFSGHLRDWNEEYQTFKEMPRDTLQERILRDKLIVKIHYEFVEAATKGACDIVLGTVVPLNPQEPPHKHMFIHNYIFFSYALDTRDGSQPPSVLVTDDEEDTDQATYVSASNDLMAIRCVNGVDAPGVSTILTAIIDFRGHRLNAQSLVPGVFQKDKTKFVYGSLDKGKTVVSDPQFHQKMKPIAEHLRFKEHSVKDSNGNVAQLYSPAQVKAIQAGDGRHYLVDLIRATPLDYNHLPEMSGTDTSFYRDNEAVLRPELIRIFSDTIEVALGVTDRSAIAEKCEELANFVSLSKDSTKTDGVQGNDQNKQHTEEGTNSEEKQKESNENENENENTQESEENKKEKEKEEDKENNEETNTGKAEGEQEQNKQPTPQQRQKTVFFNPNIFGGVNYSAVEKEEEEMLSKTVASFLKDFMLPKIATEMMQFQSTAVDGMTLKTYLHRSGVNLRYLGELAKYCEKNLFIMHLCEQEMICRAAKFEFNKIIRDVPDHFLSHAISHFLNCLFGDTGACKQPVDFYWQDDQSTHSFAEQNGHAPGSNKHQKKNFETKNARKKKSNPIPEGPAFELTSEELWNKIEQKVKQSYQYELHVNKGADLISINPDPSSVLMNLKTASSLSPRHRNRNVSTLRSFCLKAGIQIVARDYILSTEEPFDKQDILDIYPVVKHLDPKTQDGQHLLDAAKVYLAQGRLDTAFELFNEALAIFHQVYGPMHPDTATCYAQIAMVLYHANDTEQAVLHQKKVVIINERVLGLDHAETSHAYGNLALFMRDLKQERITRRAITATKRAFYLTSLLTPYVHPESPAILTHIAMMFQDLGEVEKALFYHFETLAAHKHFCNDQDNISTAKLYHRIALAYSQMNKFKEALQYERKNYDLLKDIVGPNDFRTIQSTIWVKQFTSKLVSMRIEAKQAQNDILAKVTQEKIDNMKNLSQKANDRGNQAKHLNKNNLY